MKKSLILLTFLFLIFPFKVNALDKEKIATYAESAVNRTNEFIYVLPSTAEGDSDIVRTIDGLTFNKYCRSKTYNNEKCVGNKYYATDCNGFVGYVIHNALGIGKSVSSNKNNLIDITVAGPSGQRWFVRNSELGSYFEATFYGTNLDKAIANMERGDLIARNDGDSKTHIAIYIGNNKVVDNGGWTNDRYNPIKKRSVYTAMSGKGNYYTVIKLKNSKSENTNTSKDITCEYKSDNGEVEIKTNSNTIISAKHNNQSLNIKNIDYDDIIFNNKCNTYTKLYIGKINNIKTITFLERDLEDIEFVATSANTIVDGYVTNYGHDLTNEDNDFEHVSCGELNNIPKNIPNITSTIINIIKIATPLILILWGMFDFVKATMADKEEDINAAKKKFINRSITAAIVFLVLFITQFALGIVSSKDNDTIISCIDCFITNDCKK